MKKNSIIKKTLVIILSLTTVACFSSCGGGSSSTQSETFTIGSSAQIDTLNPLASYEQTGAEIFSLIYDPLVRLDENQEASPGLADSWEVSDDNLTWTFHLNEKATWHDGEPVTASDVKYTYDMMLKTKLGYMYESYLEGIDKVTAKDDHTVVITTKEPKANMLMNTTPILPEHIWSKISEKDLEDYTNDKAIGSGPYKFVAQSDDGAIKLELNSDYYRDKGNVKYFVFTQYKNTDSLAQALKTGEIDAAVNLSATQYSQLQKDKNVKVISGEVLGFMQVGINCSTDSKSKGNKLLLDKNVRQAIEYAIDKQNIIDIAYGGQAQEGTTLINPSNYYHYEPTAAEKRSYNIAKAKEVLEAAGYKDTDGDGIREDSNGNKLSFNFINISDNTDEVKTGQLIASTCKDAGIEITQKTMDSGALQDKINSADFDMFMWGWGADLDPTTILGLLTTDQIGGNNEPHWSNTTYDSLYAKQQTIMDSEKRKEVVCEAQKLAYDNCPYIILLYDNNIQGFRSDKWQGLTPIPKDGTYFFNATICNYLNVKAVS